MRRLSLILSLTLLAGLAFASYALAARFVLPGRATATSLHRAVEVESGSAGGLLGDRDRCRAAGNPRTWLCSVYDRAGSGGVDYRVVLRDGGSCFDARLVADYGEPGMPERVSGCVHRWQWMLLGML